MSGVRGEPDRVAQSERDLGTARAWAGTAPARDPGRRVSTMRYWEARAKALSEALDADPSVVVLGGFVSLPFGPDDGLPERYPERFHHPPISEFAVAGLAVGAAMAGMRPFVAVATSPFMYYGFSPVVNEAPHVRYVTGGEVSAPVVFHIKTGFRRGGGVQHEHTPHSMLQNVPGLRILVPATPQDIYEMVHVSLTGNDPVVIVDHDSLADVEGEVAAELPASLAPVQVLRDGDDAIIVSLSVTLQRSLAVAGELQRDGGLSLAIASVRELSPSPWEAVVELVSGYPRVVFVDESRGPGSPSSYFMARIAEELPEVRQSLICTADAPAPFAPSLLDRVVPTTDAIAGHIRDELRSTTD